MHYVAWRYPGNAMVFSGDSLDHVKAAVANTTGSTGLVWAQFDGQIDGRYSSAERGVLRSWIAKDYRTLAEFVIEEFDLSETKAEG